MGNPAQTKDRKQFVIDALNRVQKDNYERRAVEACLKSIQPALLGTTNGNMLFQQIEKLVRAQNADRAVMLVEAAPFNSKNRLMAMVMINLVIVIAVAVVVFVINSGG